MTCTSGPTILSIALFIVEKWGQGKPIGVPLPMQDAKTTALAPLSTSILALVTARLPGHPPQDTNPTTSADPIS